MEKVKLNIRVVTGEMDSWGDVDKTGGWHIDDGQLLILDSESKPAVIYPPGAWLTLIVTAS